MMKLLIVKDAENNFYLNVFYAECPVDCDDLTPAIDCASHYTFVQLFRNLIVEDECGNCALSLIGNICSACEE
jgi:hypothetical protein